MSAGIITLKIEGHKDRDIVVLLQDFFDDHGREMKTVPVLMGIKRHTYIHPSFRDGDDELAKKYILKKLGLEGA